MNRDEAFLKVLKATAKIQRHVAIILEAKATEAEKARNWLCRHVLESSYSVDTDQLEESNKFHDQIVEAIEGITKVELGLAANLKAILNQDDESEGLDGFSDFLNLNGDDK